MAPRWQNTFLKALKPRTTGSSRCRSSMQNSGRRHMSLLTRRRCSSLATTRKRAPAAALARALPARFLQPVAKMLKHFLACSPQANGRRCIRPRAKRASDIARRLLLLWAMQATCSCRGNIQRIRTGKHNWCVKICRGETGGETKSVQEGGSAEDLPGRFFDLNCVEASSTCKAGLMQSLKCFILALGLDKHIFNYTTQYGRVFACYRNCI